MANNQEQFNAFHNTINASQKRRATLKTNRDTLRDRIRKYFKENHADYIQPNFHWQGSYAMYTLLTPIKDEDGLGAYDLDDGIYFVGKSKDERKSLDWYHKEVLKAVENHTTKGAEDNAPCVTVLYADGHHIDLPIYFMVDGDEHPQLAHRKEPWMESDPRDLIDWFSKECGKKPMLRRLVRYLKAWCENINNEKDFKMPTGCIMTMLAAEYYKGNVDSREDIAMRDILTAMHNALSKDDGFHCWRPTHPYEDLFEHYKKTRKERFLAELKSFKDDATRAIESKNPHDACIKWQKHLGNRFSCSTAKDEDEDAQVKSFSGTINTNSRFA
ncbi:cyclic GMP-AMP synthase DncV-like nucleotidyltransferase [Bacteroides sp. UBA939]|uniref:cyclic GMP-AMP synthase DncV-like nucleotidyltransferase n=1 Tax=Bacteroides sp. UBA939 TaxID=1946092 RepID=UPI0025BADEA5|nr:hypothetical protein [Bacteroides sp. UBA939]